MKRIRTLLVAAAVAAVGAAPAGAQLPRIEPQPIMKQLKPSPKQREEVPKSHLPPPGMCRIWLDGVPAGQQPASTDCASAVRNRPANGRVLFGDDYVDGKGAKRGRDTSTKDRRPPTSTRPRPTPDSSDVDARSLRVPGVGASGIAPIVLAAHAPATVAGAFVYPAAVQDSTRGSRASQPARERARDRLDARDRDARERRRIAAERRAQRRGDRDRDGDRDDDRTGDRRDGGAGRGRDRVIVVPPGTDPRYYDDRYAAPGRANGTCLDRNRDGWCDDARHDAGTCLDRDGDGRCDDYAELATAPYSNRFPPMRAGADVRGGRGSDAALRWLGTAEVIARTTDLNRDGVPERIQWLDANTGQLVQVWSDRNRDGVADRVEVYRNGRRVKLFGQ